MVQILVKVIVTGMNIDLYLNVSGKEHPGFTFTKLIDALTYGKYGTMMYHHTYGRFGHIFINFDNHTFDSHYSKFRPWNYNSVTMYMNDKKNGEDDELINNSGCI